MSGVDLRTFRFDWSLTFAALLMHADGTIYHRYGNRDGADPESHLSVPSLVRAMQGTLEEHAAHRSRKSVAGGPAETIETLPWMAAKIRAGKRPDCMHCHMVGDASTRRDRDAGLWKPEMAWRWPSPDRIGITLDRDDQAKVTAVAVRSPAAQAGLRAGDRLERAGAQRLLTMGDLAFVLDELPAGAAKLPLTWRRNGEERKAAVSLPSGWKVGDPRDLAWRADMWALAPKPGFGGRRLSAAEQRKFGIAKDVFAFRVGYLVTWGENRHTGVNARKAGIRKGDVVLSVGGKSDFVSERHFHAWFRLKQKPGGSVDVVLLRDGKKVKVRLPVVK